MTDALPRREVGRPRIFSDEAIFAAVFLGIGRSGYGALTLEQVAQEVGCTRQALVRRFGTKREMVLAAFTGSAEQMTEHVDQARPAGNGPLEALRDRLTYLPGNLPDKAGAGRVQANLLAFMVTSCAEPAYAEMFTKWFEAEGREIERLLDAALAEDELGPADTTVLAQVILAAWAGNALHASLNDAKVQNVPLSEVFEQIIAPYRRSVSAA